MITGESKARQKERKDKAHHGKKKASAENQRIIDSYDYLTNAASARDCTGLIPAAPKNDGELESYDALYKYQPPKIPAAKAKH